MAQDIMISSLLYTNKDGMDATVSLNEIPLHIKLEMEGSGLRSHMVYLNLDRNQ